MNKNNNFINKYTTSTRLLIKEAIQREIKVVPIYLGKVVKLIYRDHVEYLYHQFASITNAVAYKISKDKQSTKVFLKQNGVSVAKGKSFKNKEFSCAWQYAKKMKFPLVLKPIDSAHGELVFSDIKGFEEFKRAWEKIFKKYKEVILEKKFLGREYRIFSTNKKFIAVAHRMPANVIGDGENSLQKLIAIKNKDPRREKEANYFTNKSLFQIKIDDMVKAKLKKQNLTLSAVPPKDKIIYLRDNSNISTGGDSIDYTDKVHASVKKIAVRAIRAIPGLAYAGIDFMTKDITKKQNKNSYIVIEMNNSPGIDLHHSPYSGKSRNVAKEIIDILFPETKRRIY